jgi:hypothetical protein
MLHCPIPPAITGYKTGVEPRLKQHKMDSGLQIRVAMERKGVDALLKDEAAAQAYMVAAVTQCVLLHLPITECVCCHQLPTVEYDKP